MACRLRAVIWGLAGLCIFTCFASLSWLSPSSTASMESLQRPPPIVKKGRPPIAQAETSLPEITWRQEAVQAGCSKAGLAHEGTPESKADALASEPEKLKNFIVDDKNGIIYCYVPKVACTNWKRVMLILGGAVNETEPLKIPSDSVHRVGVFDKLSKYKPEDIRHRLLTYTKFVFVRHPIERIISAFRNKFEMNYTSSEIFKVRFGVPIMKAYRQGVSQNSIPKNGHGLRFSEFVAYLIDTNEEDLNEHWAIMSSLCYPCHVRYDFIGKYETLEEDSQYILEQIGAPPTLHFPKIKPSRTTSVIIDSYFNSLPPEQQKDLVRKYEDDFRIFNYHFRDYL